MAQNKKKPPAASPPVFEPHPKLSLWIFSLILILGSLIYSNTFHSFFHLDDQPSIVENHRIQNISKPGLVWEYSQERFLTYLSFALNFHFGGLNVSGYHAVNLAIHILAAWLVFLLIQVTFRTPALAAHSLAKHSRTLALFSSLLFLAHPIQTQAVTYIVQRMASFATLFYLASVFFYAKARLENKRLFYALALVTTYASMFTKQTSFTLPFALALYELTFFRKQKTISKTPSPLPLPLRGGEDRGEGVRLTLLTLLPFLASAAVIPILMTVRDVPAGEDSDLIPVETKLISRSAYLLTQFNVIRTYWRLLFLPLHQNLDYDYPISTTLAHLPTLLSLLFHVGILATAFALYRNHRIISFGILWIYLTLSVESSVIPIKDVIFEHRLYLPMFGFVLAFSSAALLILRDARKFSTLFTVLVLIFSGLTYVRNNVWKDELTLWTDVIKKSPNKARPNNTLGATYGELGDYEKATYYLERAIQINPRHPMAYFNLGAVYGKQNLFEKEVEYYEKAIEVNPKLVKPQGNLGALYGKKGDFPKAIEFLSRALELDFRYVPAYYNLGITFVKMGDYEKAGEALEKAIQINPSHAQAHYTLGLVYREQGDVGRALEQAAKLENLRPELAQALVKKLEALSSNSSP